MDNQHQPHKAVITPSGKAVTLTFSDVSPRLWSPDDPQLYTFEVDLNAGNRTVDALSVVSGFRTFEARGNRLYLNGRPYVLRGANHCPNMLAPNDRVHEPCGLPALVKREW